MVRSEKGKEMTYFFTKLSPSHLYRDRSYRRWSVLYSLALLFFTLMTGLAISDPTPFSPGRPEVKAKVPSFHKVRTEVKGQLSSEKRNLVDWAAELLKKEPKDVKEAMIKMEVLCRAGLDSHAAKSVEQIKSLSLPIQDNNTARDNIRLLINMACNEYQAFQTARSIVEAFPEQINRSTSSSISRLIRHLQNDGWDQDQVDNWLDKLQAKASKNKSPLPPHRQQNPWYIRHEERPRTVWITLRVQNRKGYDERAELVEKMEQEARQNPDDTMKMLDFLYVRRMVPYRSNNDRPDPSWIADIAQPKTSIDAYYLGHELTMARKWVPAKKMLQKAMDLFEKPKGESERDLEKRLFMANQKGRQYKAAIEQQIKRCDTYLKQSQDSKINKKSSMTSTATTATTALQKTEKETKKITTSTEKAAEIEVRIQMGNLVQTQERQQQLLDELRRESLQLKKLNENQDIPKAMIKRIQDKRRKLEELNRKQRQILEDKKRANMRSIGVYDQRRENIAKQEERLLKEEATTKNLPQYWLRRAELYSGIPCKELTKEEVNKIEQAFAKSLELSDLKSTNKKSRDYQHTRRMIIDRYVTFLRRGGANKKAFMIMLKELENAPPKSESAKMAVQHLGSQRYSSFLKPDEPAIWKWLEKSPKWSYAENNLLDKLAKKTKESVNESMLPFDGEAPDAVYAFVERIEKMAKEGDPSRMQYCIRVLQGSTSLGIEACPKRLTPLLKERLSQKDLKASYRKDFAKKLFHIHIQNKEVEEAEKLLADPTYDMQERSQFISLAYAAASNGHEEVAMKNWRRSANCALKDSQQISLNRTLRQYGLGDQIDDYYQEVKKKLPDFVAPESN